MYNVWHCGIDTILKMLLSICFLIFFGGILAKKRVQGDKRTKIPTFDQIVYKQCLDYEEMT